METRQKELCERFNAPYIPVHKTSILGISIDVVNKVYPLHGIRHPQTENTSGWYIWSGEYSSDVDFFQPVYLEDLLLYVPEIEKYLGLAPGWRMLIAEDYEDIWEDPSLLNV